MKFFKKFAAILISSLILIVSVFLFLKHIAYISLPDEYEENETDQINTQVKLYRNIYGIPHIVADNEKDLFFTVGYIHAQDRLWQMDYYRRLGKGQLSEIFGSSTIKTDKFMRAIEIEKTAYEIQKSLNINTLDILQAYSSGINYFIEKKIKKLPYEFCVLDYTPGKWTPNDCIIIQRVMALEFSVSFWSDIMMGAIAERLGPIRTLELIPTYLDFAPCVLDSAYPAKPDKKKKTTVQTDSTKEIVYNFLIPQNKQLKNLLALSAKEISDIRKTLGFYGYSKGSNCWAIKKSKKITSPAILVNDSHLPLGLPTQWYQIHVTCPSINAIGLTKPGIPFIFSGRNNNISWGFSNTNLDDCDFFIEKIDRDTNYYFNTSGNRIKFNYIKDTIKVQNSGNYIYYRKYSHRSAVINEFENIDNIYTIVGSKEKNRNKRLIKKYCITFNWLGSKRTNELEALYKLNKAKNWQQFREAFSTWGVPSLNFVYAEKNGNIGIAPVGLIPLRDKECKPQIPNPGWMPGYDWFGYKTMNDIPYLFNPAKKFVSAANNKLWRYSTNYLSSYWEPASRIQRIDNLLNLYDEYDTREAQIMQLDIYSTYAKELFNSSIPIIQFQPEKLNELERQALRRIKKWDGLMSQHTSSPMIFSQFLLNLVKNTFADELGENLYKQFISTSNIPTGRILELVSDSVSSSWFDNVNTQSYEDKYYIVQKSFKDAVKYLKGLYGTEDINMWMYGKHNILNLNHILSSIKLIKPALNLEPFETSGSNTTINTMEWNLNEPYKIVSGASMRFVADMGDTVVYTSIAGGISGDPFSEHYSNQVQLWLNGGYIALPVSKEPSSTFKLTTVFYPYHR